MCLFKGSVVAIIEMAAGNYLYTQTAWLHIQTQAIRIQIRSSPALCHYGVTAMFSTGSTINEIKTLEEVNHLFKIEQDYVLTKQSYRRPLRSYELISADAKCQFLKKSKNCGQAHQHGFVVETCDDKQVLIGHCCALNHLGLDDEKVKNDFRQLSANERDAMRRAKIENLLATRDELTSNVKRILWEVKFLQAEADRVLTILPLKLVRALIDRWKRNTLKVNCEYLIIKKGKDDRGKTVTENSWYPHDCGTLKGLGPWLDLEKMAYTQQLYTFLHKLQNIPDKKRLTNDDLVIAESVINELTGLSVLEREVKVQHRLISEFCAMPNLLITVQLFASRDLRAEIVNAIHQVSGESLQVAASRVVDAIDKSIREKYNASGLRMAP